MSDLYPWQGPVASDCLRLAFNFAPAAERARWHAAVALRDAVLASASISNEVAVCQTQLAWWRDELTRLVEGKARHPLARQLAATAQLDNEYSRHLLQEWTIVASRWLQGELPESENQWRIQAFRIHATALLLSVADAQQRESLTPGFRDCAMALSMLHLPANHNADDAINEDSIDVIMLALATHADHSDHVALAVLAGLCRLALTQRHSSAASQGPLRRLLSAWRIARNSRRKQLRRTGSS